MEVVAQQTIRATADGQLLPVKFSYIPQVPGEHKLTLEAVEQPGELVTTNNELSTFVNVLKGGLNVLYSKARCGWRRSSSAARWTPRPTSRSITCGSIPATRKTRPADFADRFKPGKYDVYILGDVDCDGLPRRRAGRAGQVRQPRGGPDHARRLSELRARRLRRARRWPRCCRWAWTGSNGSSPTSRCGPICTGRARCRCSPRRWA